MISSRLFSKLILGIITLAAFVIAPIEASASTSRDVQVIAKKKAKKSKNHKKRKHASNDTVKSKRHRIPASQDDSGEKIARVLPPKKVQVREPVVIPIQSEFSKLDPNL